MTYSIIKTGIFSFVLFFLSGVYDIHFNDVSGTDRTLASMQGKKILIVNIATGSPKINQIAGLQKLAEKYPDSLAIVAFPSNSFGKEPRTDAEIKQICENYFHTTFLVGAKTSVSGASQHAIFQWLSQVSQNGMMNAPATEDFHKYLLDKNGVLIGNFSGNILPSDDILKNAILGAAF